MPSTRRPTRLQAVTGLFGKRPRGASAEAASAQISSRSPPRPPTSRSGLAQMSITRYHTPLSAAPCRAHAATTAIAILSCAPAPGPPASRPRLPTRRALMPRQPLPPSPPPSQMSTRAWRCARSTSARRRPRHHHLCHLRPCRRRPLLLHFTREPLPPPPPSPFPPEPSPQPLPPPYPRHARLHRFHLRRLPHHRRRCRRHLCPRLRRLRLHCPCRRTHHFSVTIAALTAAALAAAALDAPPLLTPSPPLSTPSPRPPRCMRPPAAAIETTTHFHHRSL